MTGLFGTDGVRGRFGVAPIDHDTVSKLGRALGRTLRRRGALPVVVVGGDTRASTPTVFEWLAAPLEAEGASLRWAGTLPTPGVASLVRRLGADCGISISASHNPWTDNGIKIFGADGFKWRSEEEAALEEAVAQMDAQPDPRHPAQPSPELQDLFLGELRASVDGGRPLEGSRIALDCANGAASPYARALFESVGATVHSFHDSPDGRNINVDCGSTHTSEIERLTVDTASDFGVAFDGDADRLLVVDRRGRLLDGDVLLYGWASRLHRRGALEPAAIVATSMSNLGLEESLGREGVDVLRCDVGDRAVVRMMREESVLLGGEQSGHLVHLGLSTTGDGLLSALQLASLARTEDLGDWLDEFVRYPQILVNVAVRSKPPIESLRQTMELGEKIRAALGDEGRLLLRYSGTEPLMRIMIEGRDTAELESMASALATVVKSET